MDNALAGIALPLVQEHLKPIHRLARGGSGADTGGIIDPDFYVNANAYANDESTQFMNLERAISIQPLSISRMATSQESPIG